MSCRLLRWDEVGSGVEVRALGYVGGREWTREEPCGSIDARQTHLTQARDWALKTPKGSRWQGIKEREREREEGEGSTLRPV